MEFESFQTDILTHIITKIHIYFGIGNKRHIIHIFVYVFLCVMFVCLFVLQFSWNFYGAIKIDTDAAAAAAAVVTGGARKETHSHSIHLYKS